MKLSVLFKRIQHAVIQMPELEEEMEIRGITCNSQKAEEDSLFVCIQGSRADGHDYIEEACNLGASCILIEKLVSGGRMLKFPENVEYSCAMKSHFRKFGNQMSGSGNHLCNYASLLA